MRAWFEHHVHSLGLALKSLVAQPYASLFSSLVIGIALALPAGLYLILANVDRMAGSMPTQPELNLFLKSSLAEEQGRQLAGRLQQRPDIANTRFIPRDEGLKRLHEAGMDDLTAGLADNPLPDAILVTAGSQKPDALDRLAHELKALPEVDHLLADSDWARRLSALLDFGRDLVLALATLLGLALAAITGNTIRLQIYAAREEIEVSRLIGATDRFIRRPFLYFGALQGLLGGLAGWAIVNGSLAALGGTVLRFGEAWGLELSLRGLNLIDTAVLLASATLLGLLGAYLAVSYSLRKLI